MVRSAIVLILGAVILTACEPRPVPGPPSSSISNGVSDRGATEVMDIGDIESSLRLELRLETGAIPPNIKYEEITTLSEILSVVTMDISPPYPEELFITAKWRSVQGFTGHTVIVKSQIERRIPGGEAEVLEHLDVIFDSAARQREFVIRLDLLKDIDPAALDTMMLLGTAEVYYFMNTEPDAVDLDSLEDLAPEMRFQFDSNPLRVNFLN